MKGPPKATDVLRHAETGLLPAAAGPFRIAASWIDRRAALLALLLAALLPWPVSFVAPFSPTVATSLFSLLPLMVAWSAIGYVRDARRGTNRPLTRFLRIHGHRAWLYSLAGILVAGLMFAVLHGIGGSGWFAFLVGGLAVTIQLWCILGEGFLILTAILHATQRVRARWVSVAGILLLAVGLAHVAVAGIILLSDPSANDILLYAAPAAAILLFAGGLLLVVGQLVAPPNRHESLAAGETGSKMIGET